MRYLLTGCKSCECSECLLPLGLLGLEPLLGLLELLLDCLGLELLLGRLGLSLLLHLLLLLCKLLQGGEGLGSRDGCLLESLLCWLGLEPLLGHRLGLESLLGLLGED